MVRRLVARLLVVIRGGWTHDRVTEERAGMLDGKVRIRGRYADFERDSEPPRR